MSVGAGVYRVVLDRPADARGQARRRRGHHRRGRGRQLRARTRDGELQCGGITAPGNAPWVLTVGASSTKGTLDARRRHDGGLQLARSDVHRLRGEAGPRARPASAPSRSSAPGSTLSRDDAGVSVVAARRQSERPLQAVSQPERHEHGGAGRDRHRRADAAGESDAHAEPREGDSAVHGAGVSRATNPLRRARAS